MTNGQRVMKRVVTINLRTSNEVICGTLFLDDGPLLVSGSAQLQNPGAQTVIAATRCLGGTSTPIFLGIAEAERTPCDTLAIQ